MRLVAGLGNPGEQYHRTRHNAGFLVIDILLSRASALRASEIRGLEAEVLPSVAWVAEKSLAGQPVLLVKPLAFMNRSGVPIARLLAASGLSPADLLVVVDDVALALGTIRVRERGSDGGHNGLRSVSAEIGTEDFARVRIGVAGTEPPVELAEHVLSEVPARDAPLFEEGLRFAADAVECVLAEGTPVAMNRFNGYRP